MPSKQILDIESTEKDLILANQTTKKLNLSVETDQNQNVLDRFGCQNQPFAQILMTLKEQNQNFIKEIKNLRLQLEDAEVYPNT
uniref:Uncharacterized protein n=1 Tax=Sarcoptes scabiei TaxID=52283 RepID=A0A834R977_SARSC